MSLTDTIKFICHHPLNKKNPPGAIFRFIKWQLYSRITRKARILKFTNKSKLILKRSMTGATGNLYCGLVEFPDMSFLLHFLREEDLFIDIGANVGAYSVLSATHVKARTISFEPVPTTYKNLTENLKLNDCLAKCTAYNLALGSSTGNIKFTNSLDTINHVASDNDPNTITVLVDTLDNILGNDVPILIKIDVEGFEWEVLNGSKDVLKKAGLKAIIIELNGLGKKYGCDENDIHQLLIEHNFTPYTYDPFQRELKKMTTYGKYNTIYLRDLDFVKERIRSAEKFSVLNQKI